MTKKPYPWAAPGDVNAFFGLMLDNLAGLVLTVGLLATFFQFPTKFAMQAMVPGTAIGVLIGDLLFFIMAFALARRTGRSTVTAMPLGLDTPSTIGMVFFVLGPAFLYAKQQPGFTEQDAAIYTWHIGICSIFVSGVFKMICATGSAWVRRMIPRAGLLGSLAAVALVLISFLPLLKIFHVPMVGLLALAIILTTLIARVSLPFKLPGALGTLIIAGALYYLLKALDPLIQMELIPPTVKPDFNPQDGLWPTAWLAVFRFEWVAMLDESVRYWPIVIPFALGTVIGGIDCTESAAAAGDEYPTGKVIGVEAIATLLASLCGGVIQTTPYIGHPAYKAMGGRAAYTLATALFIGSAGVLGYFSYLYLLIPEPVVLPILVFIGLEITSQSFQATPKRHYPAVAFACIPALAALALIFLDKVVLDPTQLSSEVQAEINTIRMLANGFILTSLLWGASLALLIDHRFSTAAMFFSVAAACTLFGVIHSPLKGSPVFLPWQLEPAARSTVFQMAAGYLMVSFLLFGLSRWRRASTSPSDSTEHLDLQNS